MTNQGRFKQNAWWVALTVVDIYLGYETNSDAIVGVWIIGFLFILYRILLIRVKPLLNRICLTVLCATIVFAMFFSRIYDLFFSLFDNLDKDDSRQELWADGLVVFKYSFFSWIWSW